MKEIRIHGIGGQGSVMIGGAMVYCFALAGKYASSIPMFGPERRGMPVISTVRMDDMPIREKTLIYKPDCVIIQDANLVTMVPVFEGLGSDGIVVINEKCSPQELKLSPAVKKVGIVDATSVALEMLGVPITNTCMLGAFAATTKWISLDNILEALSQDWSGELLEKNCRAATKGYEQCMVYDLGG